MANKGEASLLLKIKTVGEEALKSLSNSFDEIKAVGTAAFTAISAVIVKSLYDYQQQEEAVNSLNAAMVNSGIFTKELRDDYLAQASAIQKLTLFGDEQVIAAQAAIQTQIGMLKVTEPLTMAIANFAQTQKMDLVSAATLVGKSIGGSTNALSRYGIEVSSSATKQEKLTAIVDGLNKKFGGQAVAATQGLGGIKQLGNQISDVFEDLGAKIAPTVGVVVNIIKSVLDNTSRTSSMLNTLAGAFQIAAKVGVAGFTALESIGEKLGTRIGGIVAAITLAAKGEFSAAKNVYNSIWAEIDEINTRKQKEMNDRLLAIDNAFLNEKAAQQTADAQRTTDAKTKSTETDIATDLVLAQDSLARQQAVYDLELGQMETSSLAKIQAQIAYNEKMISLAKTDSERLLFISKNSELRDLEHKEKMKEAQKKIEADKVKDREEAGRTIATLASSNNASLAAIGKAAAITQIAIDTPVAIGKAYAAFPPPFNFAAAGAVGLAMAAQAARIAGVQLAEGGIVMPTPGGTQATIGEGGQAEAVIPLDRASEFGLGGGGGITINVNGGMLGDQNQAREFALAIDRQLLELRRSNESVSFDGRVV